MWNVITQCNLSATAGEPPALPGQAQLHAPKPKRTLTLGSAGRWPALLQQQLKLPAYSRQAHAAPSAPPSDSCGRAARAPRSSPVACAQT